jgi:phosphoadenosine phosphosulfate reductase
MTDGVPDDSGVDYTDGAGETPADYPTLAATFERASEVVGTALEAADAPAVIWTGDRDSTLALYLVREVAADQDRPLPAVILAESVAADAFVARWVDRWGLDLVVAGDDRLATVIDDHGFDAVIAPDRGDDPDIAADESFAAPTRDGAVTYDRIRPLLIFDEDAARNATWGFVVPDTVDAFPAGYVPESTDDLPDGVELADIPVDSGTLDAPDDE